MNNKTQQHLCQSARAIRLDSNTALADLPPEQKEALRVYAATCCYFPFAKALYRELDHAGHACS
ncbi:hypothetical protein [Aliagarivorans taiwanensis]|uniref:hypothetical protein n=1 Tax=Aliagarivorans taiwanensis TaxID=561966 RepID=UPI00042259E2|nr:hypothetical protein [Aliagarivorans taiwanensis]